MRAEHPNIELILAKHSNVLVGSVVMWPESIHLIENLTQIISDLALDGNLLFKQVQVIHLGPSLDISDAAHDRVVLLHVGDEHLMNLCAQFFLCLLADRVHY